MSAPPPPPPPLSSFLSPVLHNLVSNIPTAPPYCFFTKSLLILKLHLGEDFSTTHSPFQNQTSAIQLVQYYKIGKCFILFSEMLVPKGEGHFDLPDNSKSEDIKTMKLCTVIIRHISTKTQQLNFQNSQCSIVCSYCSICA